MDPQQHDRIDALTRDPYPLYDRARAAEGLIFVPEFDAWLVARDADVREVLRRPDDFSSANVLRGDVMPSPAAFAVLGGGFGGRQVVVSADGAEHQLLRAPLVRGLSAARVAHVLPYARERAEALVDGFIADGHVELMAAYARRLPGDVIGRLVGLDAADVPTAVHGGHRTEELLFRPMDEAGQVAAAEDVVAGQHVLDALLRARRAAPRDDLATELVASLAPGPADQPLTLEERHQLGAQLANFLLAGHLTTTALIGTTFLHLLRRSNQWKLLCEEPERIPAAIEEAARYDSALQAFRRVATRDVTLAGTELPAGSVLLVAFGAAGRDGARHAWPDVFDITRRQEARHLAFGLGRHGCPGAQLAREQLRLTLELFTRRLPGLRIAEDGPPVTMRPTLIHRSPEALHLAW
ncbi:cytochrome P450 [Streptomyces sp. NPDC059002]|uniref:cytochrome P450 n=1 Tax=Streptomyces sp. NPDC059002 TaxID=3346690 RepID=UPI0036A97916